LWAFLPEQVGAALKSGADEILKGLDTETLHFISAGPADFLREE
jgi:hypothetical protein